MRSSDEAARSFASVVDEYDFARPGYTDEAVRWLVGAQACTVVDVGAGTGKLTASLRRLGHDVIAVEPLVPMLERLRREVPAARAVAGSAEALPLADGCADAVVVAQAFHWFDGPRALAEIARVLRPGGVLGLIWNLRDVSVPWVARLGEVIGAVDTQPERWSECFTGSPFGLLEHVGSAYEQQFDADGLCTLARSCSYVSGLDAAGQVEVLGHLRRLLAEHPDVAGRSTFDLPYVVEAYRARLSD